MQAGHARPRTILRGLGSPEQGDRKATLPEQRAGHMYPRARANNLIKRLISMLIAPPRTLFAHLRLLPTTSQLCRAQFPRDPEGL